MVEAKSRQEVITRVMASVKGDGGTVIADAIHKERGIVGRGAYVSWRNSQGGSRRPAHHGAGGGLRNLRVVGWWLHCPRAR